MFVDYVTITVKAGNGGNGASTLRRTGQTAKGGPDGGNGGNGGNIYFQGSENERDLHEFRYKKKIVAQKGVDGKSNNLWGKNAPHITILVPVGTQIRDEKLGIVYDVQNTTALFLLAVGGKGGRGNYEFRTATDQTPRYAEKGGAGEERQLVLDLKLIADVGLIGAPNAGKSSLLAVLTNATPRIGDYPFTTLEANIGMLGTHAIADIPGLIEGASKGKGLGTRFLKHIEKTRLLVHCIDCSAEDPEKIYETVRQEFNAYNPELLRKPEIILLTKIDLVDEGKIKKYTELFKKKGLEVLTCSVYDQKSIARLSKILLERISR